ncbi:GNAT family N-acetyltransferase [Paracoccus shanxieyensis]|uniref:GNAT family N-acetyltransferase n=1 Tax=Paracoccus shanxieyensis TaxID=2675752 RepID=A0A6L6IWH3_9RHOB|nr:GNAT family protein [Paracoccus shanxieyensis]MTH63400.1 GNAT family N-acetyltransferase [Paracoccus shanxieyensis]MTH86321.1 GNAT family N-acetyltransferase [Paracoccus shanxieyensis]
MIALAPLGRDQRARVDHIAVAPEQEPFCGSIAHHFALDEPECDFHIILRDARVVGFFKVDRAFAERYDFVAPDEIGLRGVMIDRAEQGRGTGKAAMRALGPYLATRYGAQTCVLTVNVVNPGARAAYLAGGFRDDGALYHGGQLGPQHILRLDLRQNTVA